MSKDREHTSGFVSGQGYTREDWDEVSDNPPLTEEDFAKAVPFREAMPEAYEALRRRPGQRGPGRKPAKVLVTLRLDRAVVEAFKAGGEGWQTRINDTLLKAIG